MDGSIRVSAKTVDDAITEALIQLGVTSDRLEYEVIEKGSAGFLGIGMKQAVIEARRKPEPVAEVKEETIPVEEVKPSVVKEQVSEPVQEKQEEACCLYCCLLQTGNRKHNNHDFCCVFCYQLFIYQ